MSGLELVEELERCKRVEISFWVRKVSQKGVAFSFDSHGFFRECS